MKRAPYHATISARRDRRLDEIERVAWRLFGAALLGAACGTILGYLMFW